MPGRIGHDTDTPEGRARFHAANERSLRDEVNCLRSRIAALEAVALKAVRLSLAVQAGWSDEATLDALHAFQDAYNALADS